MQASVSLLDDDFRHITVVAGDLLISAHCFLTTWPQSLSDAAGQTRKGWEVAKSPGPRALIHILRAGGRGQGKRGHRRVFSTKCSALRLRAPCFPGCVHVPCPGTSALCQAQTVLILKRDFSTCGSEFHLLIAQFSELSFRH